MKKIVLSFAVLAFITANAQTNFKVGDITYKVKNATQVEINKYEGKATTVAIPATVEYGGVSYDVKSIGAEAFKWTSVENVTIPASVDSIKELAFYYTKLKSVTFAEGLKYIGNRAFGACKITTLDIPRSVEVIDDNAFFTAGELLEITFHEGLKKIGNAAFYHSPKLTKLVFPNSLEHIGRTAFHQCAAVETIQFPANLLYIGDGAFGRCKKLTAVSLPSTVTHIGAEAFMKCGLLTSFTIPKNTETLGFSFIAMTSVQTLSVEAGSKHFHIVDGAVYDTKNKMLYVIPMKGTTTFKVKEGCIGINGGAAWGSELQSITLPKSLIAIGKYAFESTALTHIDLPENLTFIDEQAFADTKLKNVVVPENVIYMADGVFAQCKDLVSATLPSSIVAVYNHAFAYSSELATVTCLGSKAPTIKSYGDEYDSPFYKIKAKAVLNVPKGCSHDYKVHGWGAYFTIKEMTNGVLIPKNTDPADGSTVSGRQPLKFTINFDEPVTVVKANPNVTLRRDNVLFANSFTPDQSWVTVLSSDKKSLTLWASDYDSFTQDYKFEDDHAYFIVIPSGVVKNAAGDLNERIVIKLLGSTLADVKAPTTETGSKTVVARYNMQGQKINAPQPGINIVKYSDGTTQKILIK